MSLVYKHETAKSRLSSAIMPFTNTLESVSVKANNILTSTKYVFL